MISTSSRSLPLALIGLFLIVGSSGLLAVDCYKPKTCAAFSFDANNRRADICVVVVTEALEDQKSDSTTNTFQRAPTQCGKVRRFNAARGEYQDLMTSDDPNDLLRGPVGCGYWKQGAACAGL